MRIDYRIYRKPYQKKQPSKSDLRRVAFETAWRAPDPVNVIEYEQLKKAVSKALETLTPREERILRLRFFEEKSLLEVAESFCLSRERVRQMEAKALRKLRHPTRSIPLREFCE